ncbi:uncharacterized protein F4812DRAFT_459374 [Daldinia caldariorum]|uniref:uncharacterized protein n=1 Tax=Daldinia caldariorum TaxID=326644 RepID=UPI0020078018|nr:uncharacterized protein F4812DRAFT_459374 [Daldinia caldariorum]KAI1468092.1 hypothetical protein F4812DRAFT_459374 [Daldinia caldariorum]
MPGPFDSSHRRGRSCTRSVRRRRPTSLTSASGDESPSTSERKKQDRSQSDKQDVAVPHINVQAPTPPLLQRNLSDLEAEYNDQSYRARQSNDKGKGKGNVLQKEKGKDDSNVKVRKNRCTHVHHHHYHVHNHAHHYHIQDDKLVGEPIHEVEHSIYCVLPFDESDPYAAVRYNNEHHQKHLDQHKDVEKQKQFQPSYPNRNGNGNAFQNSGPSQQQQQQNQDRPQQNTLSGSTITRVPASAPVQAQAQAQASSASHPSSTLARTYFSQTLYSRRPERTPGVPVTHPYRENLEGNSADEENWIPAPGASYSASALARADDEASAIVQAQAPHPQTPSPSGSHSTLTTISRGIVYTGRDRDDLYRSSDEAAAKKAKKNNGKNRKGFRAWLARRLRG